MQCIHINARKAVIIIFSVLINGVQHSQMADNHMHLTTKEQNIKNQTHIEEPQIPISADIFCTFDKNKECNMLDVGQCMKCNVSSLPTCVYGRQMVAECAVKSHRIECKGKRTFEKPYICRYCYQTESWEHSCDLKANCNSIATTRSPYLTNCTVHEDILCLGSRTFNKNVYCNWTGGYRWSTALILSITLGGFGADRFYLGHWQEGIGKLFSFGGLGVWTLIDVILISLHYLGPADGSLYI